MPVFQLLPGDAFGGIICRRLPALRALAQAVCRQPAQLNVPLVFHVAQIIGTKNNKQILLSTK